MLLLNGPTSAQLAEIKESLNENDDRLENNLRLFSEWVTCQHHLPQEYDKRMLTTYLRGSKHDMEKAKRKFEMYFYIKSMLPEIYTNRSPADAHLKNTTLYLELAAMPKLTPDGYRVSIAKLSSKDASLFEIENVMKVVSLYMDVRIMEDHPIAGGIVIIDVENFTVGHSSRFLKPIMKKIISIGAQAQPSRIKQIHIVNAQAFIEKIVAMIKPVLKEKLRKRIYIHSSIEALKDYLPIDILPKDYGGKETSLHELANNWYTYFLSRADWFKEQDALICNGPIPEKYSFEADNYGTEGSFRRLAID